jgi:hypothetical protein
MTESSPRPPEIQHIIGRPLTTEEALCRYRQPRPGEVIDKDFWPPGYAALADPPPARGNGESAATAYLSPTEFSRRTDHDRRVEDARLVRIEVELDRRGIMLRGRGVDRRGPCPVCGGDDRFSINIKKQVWNCRGCSTGGDVIALVEHLDGCGFMEAVATLIGQPQAPARERDRAQQPQKTYFTYTDEAGRAEKSRSSINTGSPGRSSNSWGQNCTPNCN